jgi:hypothetical protein
MGSELVGASGGRKARVMSTQDASGVTRLTTVLID